ncbi:MAG: hypothetical protein KGZ93_02380 [Actinobacteria bacterium]|nr:hypothetical protein [Actinomycetota bacterium]
MKRVRVFVGVVVVIVVIVGVFALVQGKHGVFTQAKEQKVSVSATERIVLPTQPDAATGSYAVEPLAERIEKLSPEDKALAKSAKKSIGMYKDKDGNYVLVEVDGKKVHDDPAKKFLEEAGIKDKDKAVEVVK